VSGGKTPQILDIDKQWTTAASFTLWPLYPRKKKFRCLLELVVRGVQFHTTVRWI